MSDIPKTCVFITGTNAVGKTSLVFAIIDHFGGVDKEKNGVTYCKADVICLAGKYNEGRKYGGVDTFNCTSRLAEVVEEGLRHADVIICEGSFMDTFGMNLLNAMFKAKRHLVVNLYAEPKIILERLRGRSNGRNGKRDFEKIIKKQRRTMVAAKKWHHIGVKVLQLDTAKYSIDEELGIVLKTIEGLCAST